MARIIGFIGLAGAGKDTAANAMLDEFKRQGRQVRIGSFADPIRQISQIAGLEPYDRALKEKRRSFDMDEFCDAFQYGIDKVLGHRLEDHERAELYSFTVEALEKFTYEFKGSTVIELSPREFMQVLGTEGGQSVRRSLWVDLAALLWNAMPGAVLVTDCRFEHELAVLDTLIVVSRIGVTPVNNHVSERLAARLTAGGEPEGPVRQHVHRLHNGGSKELFELAVSKFAQTII